MRPENWPAVLNRHLDESKTLAFRWGEADCALWVSDYVKRVTGVDHAEAFRGRYRTAQGARMALRRAGYDGVERLAAARLPGVPIAFARRGDVVLHPDGQALGICNGRVSHFLSVHGGLTDLPTLDCVKAWSVD